MKTKVIRMATIAVLLAVSLILPVQAGPPAQGPSPSPPGPTDETLIGQLQQETDGKTRISYHAETGKVRFIGTSPERPVAQPAILAADASPEVAARGFLDTYDQLFGLSDQAQELTVMRSKTVDRGRSFVRFQQVYQGVPVLGGELIVQLDANKDVVSANGEVLPEPKVNVVPTVGAETAQQRALAIVAKNYGLNADDLTTTEPELWIYSPILLGGLGPRLTTLVWRMDVEPRELLPIRELVLVDAHLGAVALHFNQIDVARNRLIYDNQNNPAYGLPGNGPVRTEGQGPTGITDVDKAYDYAGNTYDFYYNYHGRDSIDNAGMALVSTVRYCPNSTYCPYQNAFWNGSQMVYGAGFPQADDVVAHEMTHGVTEYESHLFYYMQSGAINEAFSDIWGEFVDLSNGAGTDTPAVRWLIGEDEPNYGVIRSMSNPPAYSTSFGPMPDRMTSANYYCGESDNGGVHHNMGVGSKAAYLMVDGGSFNGYTVTGIGITKVAKIWYEVQTNLFTSASDYQDLYDGLYQACTNLIGTSGITSADCQEVRAAAATEMNQQPSSCPATHAPICDSGSPANLFFDDMENTASGNWTSGVLQGVNRWYYPQTANPYGFDATYATSGVYNIWGYDQPGMSDFYIRMTSDVALPAGSQAYLHFNHAYAFEDSDPAGTYKYDGGVLEYSTNGGSSWNDAGSLFTHNGYNGTISTGNSNPLQGRQAFVSESNGYFSSRLDLSSLAGQNVRFRFRIGTDSYLLSDALGWFIDDVRVYTCTTFDVIAKGSSSAPTIDGQISAGEWDNANVYDITVPGLGSLGVQEQGSLDVITLPESFLRGKGQRQTSPVLKAQPSNEELAAHAERLDLATIPPEANYGGNGPALRLDTGAIPTPQADIILPASESVTFIATGDTVDVQSYPYWWHAGDYAQGTRTLSLGSVEHLDYTLYIGTSFLNGTGHVDLRLSINGQVVGSFTVLPGELVKNVSFDFAPIAGPTYVIRLEETNTVDLGLGSITLPPDLSTMVLSSGEGEAVTLYAMNDGGHLYLAIDNPNDTTVHDYDQMGVYFDDNPLPSDGQWTNTSCGHPDGEGNFWVVYSYPDNQVKYREIVAGPTFCDSVIPAPGTSGAVGYASGHAQAEIAIDLTSSALRALVGDVINMYLWIYDYNTGTDDGQWPLGATYDNPATYGLLRLEEQSPTGPVYLPIILKNQP